MKAATGEEMARAFKRKLLADNKQRHEEYMRDCGMVKVGEGVPGSPVGDIWMNELLIEQIGPEEVRRFVRDQYEAAYAARQRRQQRGDRGQA